MLPSSESHPRLSRLILPTLAFLLLLAAALRLLPLPHEALGGDEMFSRRIALMPLGTSLTAIREDLVHPPLYYLLLKAVISVFGAGAIAVRILSVVSGLLILPLLVWLGSRLPGGRWCGLLAAGCVALGRYQIFYSQEARSYAFYTALTVGLVLWLTGLSYHRTSSSDRTASSKPTLFWIGGALLMTLLVYTHYVGAVFIALALAAVWVSRVTFSKKLASLGCGLVAAFLFVPWLMGEISVLHARHGVGENLDWQGHPSLYDLRMVWANSIGVANIPGATMLALLVILVLAALALGLAWKQGILFSSPALIGLVFMGVLAPAILFLLSEPPVNLPLFALRHVLPATVLLLLLCCYGLEQVVAALRTRSSAADTVGVTGSLVLLCFAAIPTVSVLANGPSRYPYDRIEQVVLPAERAHLPTFAAWFYGEGEPVNFYCGHLCVQQLPESDSQLPAHLILLYRPSSGSEVIGLQRLEEEGWKVRSQQYFTDGLKTAYGTSVVELERP